MTALTRFATASLAATALLVLAGCTADPAPVTPPPTPGSASGTQPSGEPQQEYTPEELNARSIASTFATEAREWLTAWDAAGCTGERAAEDVRDCQIMLMELATGTDATADLLEDQVSKHEPLSAAAEQARVTADAAEEWLAGWCGAYADAACAAPGSALVDSYRALDTSLDQWYPRGTADA